MYITYHIYNHINTYIYIYIHTYTHIGIYIYVYIYIYIYLDTDIIIAQALQLRRIEDLPSFADRAAQVVQYNTLTDIQYNSV